MRKFVLIVSLFFGSLSNIALAADPVGSGPNPFSDCGIGAALFKDTEWAAVTSNITWDLGTTAVTSATVSPQTCAKKNVKAAMLIRDTYVALVEDVARGQGEHLTAALDTFECRRDLHASVMQDVRSAMVQVVASPGFNEQQHLEKASQLFNIMDVRTRATCGA